MARKPKTTTDNTNSTVETRHAAEAQRQATANDERNKLIADTKAAQKETAKRLEAKPTDTRTISQ